MGHIREVSFLKEVIALDRLSAGCFLATEGQGWSLLKKRTGNLSLVRHIIQHIRATFAAHTTLLINKAFKTIQKQLTGWLSLKFEIRLGAKFNLADFCSNLVYFIQHKSHVLFVNLLLVQHFTLECLYFKSMLGSHHFELLLMTLLQKLDILSETCHAFLFPSFDQYCLLLSQCLQSLILLGELCECSV